MRVFSAGERQHQRLNNRSDEVRTLGIIHHRESDRLPQTHSSLHHSTMQ